MGSYSISMLESHSNATSDVILVGRIGVLARRTDVKKEG